VHRLVQRGGGGGCLAHPVCAGRTAEVLWQRAQQGLVLVITRFHSLERETHALIHTCKHTQTRESHFHFCRLATRTRPLRGAAPCSAPCSRPTSRFPYSRPALKYRLAGIHSRSHSNIAFYSHLNVTSRFHSSVTLTFRSYSNGANCKDSGFTCRLWFHSICSVNHAVTAHTVHLHRCLRCAHKCNHSSLARYPQLS
jgi:hypothetical protein